MANNLLACLKKAGEFLHPEDKAAILKLARQERAEGAGADDAARAAIARQLEGVGQSRAEIEANGLPEPVAEEAAPGQDGAAAAEGDAAGARLAEIDRQFPALLVRMDGMEQAVPLREFLKRVKAEAAEEAADAPLYQVAAECFLLNGGV